MKKRKGLSIYLILLTFCLTIFVPSFSGATTSGDWYKQTPKWTSSNTITWGDKKLTGCTDFSALSLCDRGIRKLVGAGTIANSDDYTFLFYPEQSEDFWVDGVKVHELFLAVPNSDFSKGTLVAINKVNPNGGITPFGVPKIDNSSIAKPGQTVPSGAQTYLQYFNEPYISGIFVDPKGVQIPNVRYAIYKINPDGTRGDIVPAIKADALTGSYPEITLQATLNNPTAVPGQDSDGTFVTISGKGLLDGKYSVVVDELTTEAWWLERYKNLPAIQSYDFLNCTLNIPKCIADKLSHGEVRLMGERDFTIASGKSLKDQKVVLQAVEVNQMDKALSDSIKLFGGFVTSALRWSMGQVRGLLNSTGDYVLGVPGKNEGMIGPWTALRNIALTLLVIGLIIIAFANVLQLDIEQYGLNRMIPKMIIAIIMAFSSWLIVTFFFDFTKAIQDQAVGLIGGTNGLDVLGGLTITTPTGGDIVGKLGAVLLLLALLVGVLICGFVLLFYLLMRIVMLSFLLVVAPLAFIMNIVPFASGLYKQWWSEFWKWMFMGPIALVIIALGSVIASSVGGFGSGQTLTDATVTTGGNILIGLLIFGASLYVAATLPAQWGGKIMQSFGKFGKNAWGKTGGALLKTGGKAAWGATGGKYVTRPIAGAFKGWRSKNDETTQQHVDRASNAMLNKIPGGKYGMDQDIFERNQKAGILDAEAKRFAFEDKDQFTAAYNDATSPLAKQAILLAGMRKGLINDNEAELSSEELTAGKKPGLGAEIAKQAEADNTGLLMAVAMKEHREALIKHGSTGPNGSAQLAAEDIAKKFSTAKPAEIGAITKRAGELNMGAKGADGRYADGIGKYAQGITQANVDKLAESQTSAYIDSLTGLTSFFGGPTGVTPKAYSNTPSQGTGSSADGTEQRPSGLWIKK